MRGSRQLRAGGLVCDGIIPAHAGLTAVPSGKSHRTGDHPRACGVHKPMPSFSGLARGSSPRMRGSRIQWLQKLRIVGIIPAHAGLTLLGLDAWYRRRDHPRACGAHKSGFSRPAGIGGSSPRMRGSLAALLCGCTLLGIIPAHAGLTGCLALRLHPLRDHPRACGAHAV